MRTKKNVTLRLTILAMFSALAFLVVTYIRIPIFVDFLKYEPKDVIIIIGGFLFGPLSAAAISFVVSLIEMITISSTGWIGFVMNVLSSCAFASTAAFIYKKKRNIKGAVLGLILGSLLMTAVMIIWNYCLTPLYMKVPREDVFKMLIPIFLPFNILKSTLNSALAMLLYKPVVTVLRKQRLIPPPENTVPVKGKVGIGLILLSSAIALTSILVIFVLNGKI